jgi:DNA-binding transcriptional MerR regulator
MTEYSIGDVADRAGVANDYVVTLVELGILSSAQEDHFSEGDVRRVRLMQTLERAGMPLQGVAAAVRSGNLSLGFLDTAAYDRLASLSDVTQPTLGCRPPTSGSTRDRSCSRRATTTDAP